jgi:hypothetical protein
MGWRDDPIVSATKAPKWAKDPVRAPNDPIETPEPGLLDADNRDMTPGRAASALHGAANFSSFGLSDEIGGAAQTPVGLGKQLLRSLGLMDEEERVSDAISTPGAKIKGRVGNKVRGDWTELPKEVADSGRMPDKTVGEIYREERDGLRAYDKKALDANPLSYLGGGVGSLLANPTGVARIPMAATRLGRAMQGAKQGFKFGAAYGAGSSEADLTKGEVGDFAGDVEDSAALSAPLGSAGQLLMGRYADKKAKAAADALAQKQKAAEKALNSARGALGAETSAGFRTLEQAERAVADPLVAPEVRAQAEAFLKSELAQQLRNQVLANAAERGQGQLARIADARDGMAKAAANAAPDAVNAATTDYLNASTVKQDVLPRALNYIQRWLPQKASQAAGGGEVGQVAGALVGAQLGNPGTSIANMLRNPRFRYKTAGAAGALANAGTQLTPVEAQAIMEWLRSKKKD